MVKILKKRRLTPTLPRRAPEGEFQGSHLKVMSSASENGGFIPGSGERRKEGKLHQQLKHPRILPLISVIEARDRMCIVTQFARGGDLADHLHRRGGRLELSEAQRMFSQLVEAVRYLHLQKGVAHRDIKPENILLDESGNVLLGDFGLACKIGEEGRSKKDPERAGKRRWRTRVCGTQGYQAPCLLRADVSYEGREVDCWALGVVLFFMLQGRLPFESSSAFAEAQKIRQGRYRWDSETLREGEECVRELVERLLVVENAKRATIEEVSAHPWVRGVLANGASSPEINKAKEDPSSPPKMKRRRDVVAMPFDGFRFNQKGRRKENSSKQERRFAPSLHSISE